MNTNAKIQIIRTDDVSGDIAANVMVIDGYVVSEVPLQMATQTTVYDDLIKNIEQGLGGGLVYKMGTHGQLEESLQSLYDNALYVSVAMSRTGADGGVKTIFRNVPIIKEGNRYILGSLTSTGFLLNAMSIAFTKNFMRSNGFDDVTDLNLSIIAYKRS